MLARVVEDECDARARCEQIEQPQAARPRERDSREPRGDAHREGLRADQHAPVVEAIGDDAAVEPADHERPVAAEDEQADLERRVGALEDEPRQRRVLHPRTAVGDDLACEIKAVVAVLAQAREHPLDLRRWPRAA